jgi:hypothetical protein
MRRAGLLGLLLLASAAGCDDPPPKNPFEPAPDKTKTPPPLTEPPKPSGPPQLSIDTLGPKVGFFQALLEHQEGRANLHAELEKQRSHFAGKPVSVVVDRKAKLTHVAVLLEELGALGAKPVTIKTESRKDFPAELAFTPENSVGDVPKCSVVAMVTEDRGTAVWKLSGGVAGKRGKGMAGPDLTMTGDTIVRGAKACEQSRSFFVSAAAELEWGLAFDLAASTKALEKAYFDEIVFLGTTPVPGHKIDLKR